VAAARSPKVLVIGGGIGGLNAAVALRKAGIDVTVFERLTDMGKAQRGLAFLLWHNGMRVLENLGLADEAHVVASREIERFETLTPDGRVVWGWDVTELTRKLGSAYPVGIQRTKLHEVLLESLGPEALKLGRECVSFEQDKDGVTARFADGSEERGDILVDAEGTGSVLRDQVIGLTEPRYSGITLWHTIVDFDHEVMRHPAFRELGAPGVRFKSFPVTETQMYWSCLAKAPQGEQDPEEGPKQRILELTREFAEPTQALVEAASAIYRADITGREPAKVWGQGRMTMLGDAVHPTTPVLGQGASQAMEDGLVLSKRLSEHDDVVAALRAYEAIRIPRATKISKQSWSTAQRSMVSNPMYTISIWIQKRLRPLIVKGYQNTVSYDASVAAQP
jgi:2-polyprenyl-6-methoxyphenol hydroxylase-like FAD-dependent oxidoreductase